MTTNYAIGDCGERVLCALRTDCGMTLSELARESGVKPHRVDNVVATLVRYGYAQRVRRGDAIMRYLRTDRTLGRPAVADRPARSVLAATRYAQLQALILPILLRDGPLSSAQILSRLDFEYPGQIVRNCLQVMRRSGLVAPTSRSRIAARWAAVLPPASAGAHSSSAGPAPVALVQSPTPPPRIATPHALRAAATGTYTGTRA